MPEVPDSTEIDPDGHKIVFENDHVRVLEVRSPAGQNIPMHTHPPRLVIAVGGYRLKASRDAGVAFTLGVGLERFEAFLPLLGLRVPGPAGVSG